MQRIELSEGLSTLRAKTGKMLTFVNFITNYEGLRQTYIERQKTIA